MFKLQKFAHGHMRIWELYAFRKAHELAFKKKMKLVGYHGIFLFKKRFGFDVK
jgi:hypothetical protein